VTSIVNRIQDGLVKIAQDKKEAYSAMAASDQVKDQMVETGNNKWSDLLHEKMALMKKT